MNEQPLLELLEKNKFIYELHHHVPVFTTQDILPISIEGAHSKNLFIKDRKKTYFLISTLAHKRVDLKTVSKSIGKGGLSFSNPEELAHKLQLTPGSVSPFGLMNDQVGEVTFILDKDFLFYDRVNFHPLRNDMTVTISLECFLKFCAFINHPPVITEIPVLSGS